jgi:hypothetical protein
MIRRAVISTGLAAMCSAPAFARQPASGTRPADAKVLVSARELEEGRPFIRAYQPLEIGGGSQTWCIVQDRRGVL